MKVEYVAPFVQAASDLLEIAIGDAETGVIGLSGTTFSTANVNIAMRVDGALRGDVVYSMSTLTAQKLARSFTGIDTQLFGREMGKVLARLGNALVAKTENLLATQGLECEISRPVVFQGLNVEFSGIAPALIVPIETSIGSISVTVAVDDDQQNRQCNRDTATAKAS